MSASLAAYAALFLLGTFISSVSQVMLKKSAQRSYPTRLAEYANPLVAGAYVIFVAATLLTIVAYRVVPLSLGPILEATSYVYVTVFGVTIFHERMSVRKLVALGLIIAGIVVYSLSV